MKLINALKSPIIAPVCASAYAVLLQYNSNQSQMAFCDVWRFLIVTIALTWLIGWTLSRVFVKERAAALLIGLLILFFSNDYSILVFACAIPIPLLAFAAFRRGSRGLSAMSSFLNTTGIAAVILVTVSIVNGELNQPPQKTVETNEPWLQNCKLPNVYYLILDAYGRADYLKQNYNVDNSAFVEGLRQLGFYVADHARANYVQTLLSLSASLNMDYIESIIPNAAELKRDRSALRRAIRTNRVTALFKKAGHKVTFISTGYSGTAMEFADESPTPFFMMNEFENFMYDLTAIPDILKLIGGDNARSFQYRLHRNRVLFALETLGLSAAQTGSHFVVAHVLSPHPPFVFGENGESLPHREHFSFHDASQYLKRTKSTPERYVKDYGNQLKYINTKVLESVRTILEHDPSAVILIQGDHGPGAHLAWGSMEKSNPAERAAILSAYRVPVEVSADLYPEISPVNSFRTLFRHYCSAPLPNHQDETYFSLWKSPYTFIHMEKETFESAKQ